jgi:hypothetical protein
MIVVQNDAMLADTRLMYISALIGIGVRCNEKWHYESLIMWPGYLEIKKRLLYTPVVELT